MTALLLTYGPALALLGLVLAVARYDEQTAIRTDAQMRRAYGQDGLDAADALKETR
jgi:hypothetical protein